MAFSSICNKVCNMAIGNYHLQNHTDRPEENPFGKNSIEHSVYQECWAYTAMWHLENRCMNKDADNKDKTQIQLRIEACVREQHQASEMVRRAILQQCAMKEPTAEARMVADRLIDLISSFSELLLQIYHTSEQMMNSDSPAEQIDKCQQMLDEMITRKTNLSILLDQQMNQIRAYLE